MTLDELDLALLRALQEHPRAGALELSRTTSVARGTVQARLRRMEEEGVVTGYGPDVDLRAAGFPVQAYVTLEIAQGALDEVHEALDAIPEVVEAVVTTGTFDVLCLVATASHEDLQRTLLRLDQSPSIVRSTSIVVLSVLIPRRVQPLLESAPRPGTTRAPAYRSMTRE
ncbi:Lrp/AsnC family transcriptional regulator [Mumia sp. DW29H23]|uniref:Lrp/AsnC family transcriptional regulator n=1 Tax=Mumia sp. DW29H23 TaxID=3421241 RepID=UPI003D69F829